MKTTDFIKIALDNSRNWSMGLLMDMQDAPLTQPTVNGGNHPLWVLGHLTHSESELLDVFARGDKNRFPELAEKFGIGIGSINRYQRLSAFRRVAGEE